MTETIKGPPRAPAQMLQEQSYDGHKSLHDDSEAERLGIKAGPIEGRRISRNSCHTLPKSGATPGSSAAVSPVIS